jgi:hypothetical protein
MLIHFTVFPVSIPDGQTYVQCWECIPNALPTTGFETYAIISFLHDSDKSDAIERPKHDFGHVKEFLMRCARI